MAYFCIKTNDNCFINYFMNNPSSLSSDFYIRKKKSKIYTNIFIHYKGNNINTFYDNLSDYITDCIIKIYEPKIIDKFILSNYFYFFDSEQLEIKKNISLLIDSDINDRRKELIKLALKNYLSDNNTSMILDGFITFRLKDYIEIIDYIVDLAVNNFLIKKEYFEFIELLRKYISKHESILNTVHLLYFNNESILLDSNFNIIPNSFDINLLSFSDIEFSTNDYSLNTLLNILPKNLYIHLVDSEDEFINTLKLIFENRIYFCNNCTICNYYKQNLDFKL